MRRAVVPVLLIAAFPAVAEAAPKPKPPSCNLVKDPLVDATVLKGQPGAAETNLPDLDLAGGDFGTNKVTFRARFKLKSLHQADPTSPTGRYYEMTFKVPGRGDKKVSLALDVNGNPAVFLQNTTAKLDLDKAWIDVEGPLSALGLTPGTPVNTLRMRSGWYGRNEVPGSSPLVVFDDASSTAAYRVADPTCLFA